MRLVLYGISAGLGVLQHERDAGFHSPPLEWLQVALDSEESQRVVLAVIRHFDRIAEPKLYLDRILWKYEEEGGVLPPPQLSVASNILAGMCTDILFRLATGSVVKTFPKFYYYSIADDVL